MVQRSIIGIELRPPDRERLDRLTKIAGMSRGAVIRRLIEIAEARPPLVFQRPEPEREPAPAA